MKKNKYDKEFYDMEKKIDLNSKYVELKSKINLYKGLKKTGNIYLIKSYSLKIEPYILALSSFPIELQEIIINNVISLFNKEYLIMFFMRCLTVELTLKNDELINLYMKSFIATKLIKDINLKGDIFTLTLLDSKKITFSREWDTKKQIDETTGQCHNFCYFIMENYAKDRNDVYSVTILEKDVYNKDRYHTFLLIDGVVRDYSRNICIKYEDYKKVHNFKVLLCISSKQLFKNIAIKESKSDEFKNSNTSEILRYAIHKQMKKEKRLKEV